MIRQHLFHNDTQSRARLKIPYIRAINIDRHQLNLTDPPNYLIT